MAKKKKKKVGGGGTGAGGGGGSGGLGPPEPRPGDEPIEPTDTAESIVSRVQLACDDDTGVFFFRHGGKLFMRIVEFG